MRKTSYDKSSVEAKVTGASPYEMIKMLLDRMCTKISFCVMEIEDNTQLSSSSMVVITKALLNAYAIATELRSIINPKQNPVLSEYLINLYDIFLYHVGKVISTYDYDSAVKAKKVAVDLLDIWKSIPDVTN